MNIDVETILDEQDQGPSAKEAREERAHQIRLAVERDTIARLAAMDAGGEYERARKEAAKKLGWRTAAVDAAVKDLRDAGASNNSLNLSTPEPWPDPVNGAALLDALAKTIASYVILPLHAAKAVALWILFAHTVDCFDVAPRLAILSAVMRSGKTTLLRIISWLTPRALLASNISPAALFRVIELARPTLQVDEADSLARDNEELRGILNSGHDRDAAFVVRCDGEDNTPRRFSTWGALAIAAIGKLPATWLDRSIVLHLKRRLPTEKVERITPSCRPVFDELARKCARWSADHAEKLRQADTAALEELNDRANQNWQPLLAIATMAGDEWPELARKAAVVLSGAESAGEASLGVMLLTDLHMMFADNERMSSASICEALAAMEGHPWPEFGKSRKAISQNQLARALAPFGIQPKTIRVGDETPKGYELKDFADAFARYLQTATPPQPNGEKGFSDFSKRNTNLGVADGKLHSAYGEKECGGVADRNPQGATRELF